MGGSWYLIDEKEAESIAVILSNLTYPEHRGVADNIVSDLIESGLCNPEGGPRAYSAWTYLGTNEGEHRIATLKKAYLGNDDEED